MSFPLGAPVPARLGWEAETRAEDQAVPCARVKVKEGPAWRRAGVRCHLQRRDSALASPDPSEAPGSVSMCCWTGAPTFGTPVFPSGKLGSKRWKAAL